MSVYYYKKSRKNMVIKATLQTKLACTTLVAIIINVCFLIAVIAFISSIDMCKKIKENDRNNNARLQFLEIDKQQLETTINENPWMLAFIIFPERLLVGTASIISKNWAITTSHCVEKVSDYPISKKAFRGGSSFWNKNGFYHFIVKLIPHEKFNPHLLDYNIALAQVSRPFVYTHEVPILISTKQPELVDGNSATVIGWPILRNSDDGYCLLKREVILISETNCSETIIKMKNGTTAARSLCAHASENEHSSCIFTSGAALVVNKSIIGLVSWGVTCSKTPYPGIYVYLKKMFDWIQEIKTNEQIPIKILENEFVNTL